MHIGSQQIRAFQMLQTELRQFVFCNEFVVIVDVLNVLQLF